MLEEGAHVIALFGPLQPVTFLFRSGAILRSSFEKDTSSTTYGQTALCTPRTLVVLINCTHCMSDVRTLVTIGTIGTSQEAEITYVLWYGHRM